MAFNHQMLRLGRVSQGITQTELAGKVKTTQGRIAKLEDQLATPSAEEAARLAEALHFPLPFFEHDMGSEGFGSCCMYHRKRQSLAAGLLNTLHARINIIGLGIVRLLNNVTMSSTLEFPNLDVDEYEGPSHVAQLLRRQWKISPGPIKNLLQYVESAGGIVVQIDFGTDKLDAVSLWPRGSRPLFFLNNSTPTDRWRFTLSHEVGHLVMHRIPTPNAEDEADEFASELLMPTDDIRDELTQMSLAKAARLKLRWRTSMQAIIRKAHSTKNITDRKYRSLFTELSAAGYRKKEPVNIEPEVPKTVSQLLEFHRKQLGYTETQLREMLFCSNAEQFSTRFECGMKGSLRIASEV